MVWNEKLKREIPSEWQESSIGEQGVYNTDFTANGSFAGLAENVKYNEGERYAMLVRIVDFNDDFSDPEKFVYINKHGYDYLKTCHLHGGEIIICNVGNAGATYRCPNIGLNMALGPNGVMLNDERLNNYLYLYFCSAIGQHSIKTITSGSIQLKFNKTSLRNLPILMPAEDVIAQFNDLVNNINKLQNEKWLESRELIGQRNKLLNLMMNGQAVIR